MAYSNTSVELMSRQVNIIAAFQRSIARVPNAAARQALIIQRSPQLVNDLLSEWTSAFETNATDSSITNDESQSDKITKINRESETTGPPNEWGFGNTNQQSRTLYQKDVERPKRRPTKETVERKRHPVNRQMERGSRVVCLDDDSESNTPLTGSDIKSSRSAHLGPNHADQNRLEVPSVHSEQLPERRPKFNAFKRASTAVSWVRQSFEDASRVEVARGLAGTRARAGRTAPTYRSRS